jgi:hypothetical protein
VFSGSAEDASARKSGLQDQEPVCKLLSSVCCCPQVTRAKNNVILFDRDSEKRAPFFHLLRRLGLVRVVKSLMGDGADASKFGLSQVPVLGFLSCLCTSNRS